MVYRSGKNRFNRSVASFQVPIQSQLSKTSETDLGLVESGTTKWDAFAIGRVPMRGEAGDETLLGRMGPVTATSVGREGTTVP